MRMKEKIAVVTGAASGIGKEIARAFAREGANVCVADLALEAARSAAAEIAAEGGGAMAVAMDVADEKQVDAGIAAAVARYGGVDVLVSNAGIQHIAPLVELSLGDWRRVLAIHLDGGFLTTRACLRHMVRWAVGARSSTWARCIPRKPRRSRALTWRQSTGCSGSAGSWRRKARGTACGPT